MILQPMNIEIKLYVVCMWDPLYYIWGTPLLCYFKFDNGMRPLYYGILTERIYMLFIIPVILLNVCGLLMAVAGQPLFGLALCGLSFLYIAKQFID